jgi:hypothetical protein
MPLPEDQLAEFIRKWGASRLQKDPETGEPLVVGAMQVFCDNEGSVENFSTLRKDVMEANREFVSVDDAQAAALLDLRLFNTDRHEGNLLVVKRAEVRPTAREVRSKRELDVRKRAEVCE